VTSFWLLFFFTRVIAPHVLLDFLRGLCLPDFGEQPTASFYFSPTPSPLGWEIGLPPLENLGKPPIRGVCAICPGEPLFFFTSDLERVLPWPPTPGPLVPLCASSFSALRVAFFFFSPSPSFFRAAPTPRFGCVTQFFLSFVLASFPQTETPLVFFIT